MTACFMLESGTIELYFYAELDDVAHAEAERHFVACGQCRQALEELKVIRAALAVRPDVATPVGGDWSGFMTRLEGAIGSQRASPAIRPVVLPASGAGRGYAAYLVMAALLALVTMSIAYVVRSRAVLVDQPAVAGLRDGATEAEPTGGSPGRLWTADSGFASLTEQHFERSKLVVLGLANKDPREVGPGGWAYERELASTLLSDTRLYRLAAEEQGMTSLAKIMGDLELVLLQTAMSRDPEPGTLQQIQSLIRKRDLVTKMNVVNVAGM